MSQEERNEVLERIDEIKMIIDGGLYEDREEERELKQELRELSRTLNKK